MTNKKKKIKSIINEAEKKQPQMVDAMKNDGEVHRPQTVKVGAPKSYFKQGFADINKSKYIPGGELKEDEQMVLEKKLAKISKRKKKKEQEFEMN